MVASNHLQVISFFHYYREVKTVDSAPTSQRTNGSSAEASTVC